MTNQIVFVLNGPNLGRLGKRQPEIYGLASFPDLAKQLVNHGLKLGLTVKVKQTDSESQMMSWLHEAADNDYPVIINPGAWTHYSIAVADAITEVKVAIEVHISNIHKRESFRRNSVISPYVNGVIAGLGTDGYELALAHIANIVRC